MSEICCLLKVIKKVNNIEKKKRYEIYPLYILFVFNANAVFLNANHLI